MGWKFLCCVCGTPEKTIKKHTTSVDTVLDLSRCNLYEIPMIEENIDILTEIDISYNKINELDPILMRAKNLKVLNLSDNQLRNIPEQLSTAFKHLRYINVSHNLMSEIPAFFNANFTNLHTIDLSNNPISKILDGTITELVSLKELRLNACNLNFLPANIARLVNLESLELRENYLESLPPSIKMLTKLKLLDIGRNNFEELPAELGYLFNIQELIVDENNLMDLSVVAELINLRHLDICNNNLMSFPEEITKCSLLETLYCDGNEFEMLPDSIGNLQSLQRLNLNYVRLKYLTNAIGSCQSLQELNIHENLLEYLPSSIGFLRNLQILVAYDNRLIQLPNELASCIQLTLLNVANNKLQRLPENIGYLKKLRSLNVIGNYLMYLPLSLDMLDLEGLFLSPFQEGMKKPNLSRVELMEGIALSSPLLEQNYKPIDHQKSVKTTSCKIHFDVNNAHSDDINDDNEFKNEPDRLKSPEHNHIIRIPTPTQRERKRLEKFARTISAEHREVEIKEARVITATSSNYSNVPRQRRSLDPEYIEVNNTDFRPLPPPYIIACQYSKMSQNELDNFQKMSRNSVSNNDYTNSNLPLLSKNDLVQCD